MGLTKICSNSSSRYLCLGVSKFVGLDFCGFWQVPEGPGGFEKLREAFWINFRVVWYLTDFMVPNYDQTNKTITTKKATTFL